MSTCSITDVDVAGKRVLIRVDFNVPLQDGVITDDRRIRMALPTIESVLSRGGSVVLMSHLGRPSGTGIEAGLSLAPVARRLAELCPDRSVVFVEADCASDEAAAAASALEPGSILLLENLRFNAGEKAGDATFAGRLAGYADVYCNDAFGTAHRTDASMVGVPQAMPDRPRVAGMLLMSELKYLSETIDHAQRPFVAILGGAKVSDKLAAIENLIGRVDTILIGGAMAYTFLAAEGMDVGRSLVEPDRFEDALRIRQLAAEKGTALLLPSDHVCAAAIETTAEVTVAGGAIGKDLMGLDIGPESYSLYVKAIRDAKTIVWNGPMGVFETPPFDVGTRKVAEAVATATEGGAVSVVGGGDSAAAVARFGLEAGVSHVSTGGGASLKMLEGARFEALKALSRASEVGA